MITLKELWKVRTDILLLVNGVLLILTNLLLLRINRQTLLRDSEDYLKSNDSREGSIISYIFTAITYLLNRDFYNNIKYVGNGYKNFMLSGNKGSILTVSKDTTLTPQGLDLTKPVKNLCSLILSDLI